MAYLYRCTETFWHPELGRVIEGDEVMRSKPIESSRLELIERTRGAVQEEEKPDPALAALNRKIASKKAATVTEE